MKRLIKFILVLQLLTASSPAFCQSTIAICSFNIQFLGNSTSRDDTSLAEAVKDNDIVIVQELVAPPYEGNYPDGTSYSGDEAAAEFFEEMKARGFEYVLSEEDTGTGSKIHNRGSATEWWVAFYKPDTISTANDLPHGFLDSDRSDNPNFERVPYAFPFRSKDENLDFVLISVHLQPGKNFSSTIRRLHELDTIARWIDRKDNKEKDFIILGDMNIEDCEELEEATPQGYVSLNSNCIPTNTNINGPKPYDHVMYRISTTKADIDNSYQFKVVNLINEMRDRWDEENLGPYPGEPYDHNKFRKYYSDHSPVEFKMLLNSDDD